MEIILFVLSSIVCWFWKCKAEAVEEFRDPERNALLWQRRNSVNVEMCYCFVGIRIVECTVDFKLT